MKTRTDVRPAFNIESIILTVRGEKVLLDSDQAQIYGVPTFRFNEAVKRNVNRFSADFRFQLTPGEWESIQRLRSQTAILKTGRGRHRKFLPNAFAEPGAIMATNVLNSPQAVRMSVFVVGASNVLPPSRLRE